MQRLLALVAVIEPVRGIAFRNADVLQQAPAINPEATASCNTLASIGITPCSEVGKETSFAKATTVYTATSGTQVEVRNCPSAVGFPPWAHWSFEPHRDDTYYLTCILTYNSLTYEPNNQAFATALIDYAAQDTTDVERMRLLCSHHVARCEVLAEVNKQSWDPYYKNPVREPWLGQLGEPYFKDATASCTSARASELRGRPRARLLVALHPTQPT